MDSALYNINIKETPLQNLMKEIGDAVKLDDECHDKDAYVMYSSCIFKIASNLLFNIKFSECKFAVTSNVTRQVKLLQHCVERINSLVEKMELVAGSSGGDHHFAQTYNPMPQVAPSPPDVSCHKDEVVSKSRPIHVTVPLLPPENNPHIYNKSQGRAMSPLEKAQAQNTSLIIAYKARMQRQNKSNFSAHNYSLMLQRKMAENLAIAKSQEVELAKKMKARQERLEAETARRFAHPSGISLEEKEDREMYKNILAYENDLEWLSQWRQKMAAGKEDPILICRLVQEILRCSDHPFTEMLRSSQNKVYEQLYPLVANRHPELELVKVEMPENMWPSAEYVADILSKFAQKTTSHASEERRRRRRRSRGSRSESNSEPANADSSNENKELDGGENGDSGLDVHGDVKDADDAGTDAQTLGAVKLESGSESRSDQSEGEREDNSGEESEPENDILSAVSQTQAQLRQAYDEGVESELTLQRRQARLLMLRINKDYEDLGEENFDDLFDDDDDDSQRLSDGESNKLNEDIFGVPQRESGSTIAAATPNASLEGNDVRTNKLYRSTSSHVNPGLSHEGSSEVMFTSLPPMPCTSDHVLEPQIKKTDEQCHVSKMSIEAYDRHLEAICHEVHCHLDKLLRVMVVAYEFLDNPVSKEQCAVALEEPFFKLIWTTLFRLFRLVNHRKELILACVMTSYKDATLEAMKVNPKFQLTSMPGNNKPYQEAIEELLRLPHYYTIPSKLDCIVKVCHLICECVDKFYSAKKFEEGSDGKEETAPAMAADDLLPVLTYVIIQSRCPQLITESQAMIEFIAEGYMMGEEGYCLTTFQTATEYLLSLYSPPG